MNNHEKAWLYFYPEGNGRAKRDINVDTGEEILYVLHHIDKTLKFNDPTRYNEWRIDDLVMITNEEHSRLHQTGRTGYKLSPETCKKMSKSKLGDKNPSCYLTDEQKALKSQRISEKIKAYYNEHTEEVIRIASVNGKKAYQKPFNKVQEMLDNRRKSMLGKRWVNNGTYEELIDKDKECPKGFSYGRLKKNI